MCTRLLQCECKVVKREFGPPLLSTCTSCTCDIARTCSQSVAKSASKLSQHSRIVKNTLCFKKRLVCIFFSFSTNGNLSSHLCGRNINSCTMNHEQTSAGLHCPHGLPDSTLLPKREIEIEAQNRKRLEFALYKHGILNWDCPTKVMSMCTVFAPRTPSCTLSWVQTSRVWMCCVLGHTTMRSTIESLVVLSQHH